jgi:hypothetical protein
MANRLTGSRLGSRARLECFVVGFDEAAGGQRAQGDEGAEVRELLRTQDRRRRQHEHLPVPRVLRPHLMLLHSPHFSPFSFP